MTEFTVVIGRFHNGQRIEITIKLEAETKAEAVMIALTKATARCVPDKSGARVLAFDFIEVFEP